MRPVLVVALLVVGMPLSVLAPVADAFTWCAAVGPEDHRCAAHVACVGWNVDPYTGAERCQYGVPLP